MKRKSIYNILQANFLKLKTTSFKIKRVHPSKYKAPWLTTDPHQFIHVRTQRTNRICYRTQREKQISIQRIKIWRPLIFWVITLKARRQCLLWENEFLTGKWFRLQFYALNYSWRYSIHKLLHCECICKNSFPIHPLSEATDGCKNPADTTLTKWSWSKSPAVRHTCTMNPMMLCTEDTSSFLWHSCQKCITPVQSWENNRNIQ